MKVKDIALIFLAVCVAGLLILLFTRNNNNDLIKAKDETIKAIQRERDAYIEMRDKESENIAEHRKKDSILHELYLSNQKIHESFEKELKDIPANIKRIAGNDDSIIAAFKNFN